MQSERGRPARSGRPQEVMVRFAERLPWSLTGGAKAPAGPPLPTSVRRERAGRPRSVRIGPAKLLGISEDTLQNGEQGRRQPAGPAKVLLKITAKHPKIVLETAA